MIPRTVIFAVFASLVASPLAFATQQGVHVYRYQVELRSLANEYRDEIADGLPKTGRAYQVEYDSAGRISRETDYLDGKAMSVTKVHYTGGKAFFDNLEISSAGQVTAVEKFQRDSSGAVVRADRYTSAGQLTDSIIYEHHSDCYTARVITSEGALIRRIEACFNPDGALVHRVYAERDVKTAYSEDNYDPDTGRQLTHKQFRNKKLSVSAVYTYHDNDQSRVDAYDANGKWFASDEKRFDQPLKRTTALPNGSTKEIVYRYDEHYFPQNATVTVDGKFVCTLTFESKSDGAVVRTLVHGPDGSLWAEYPAPIIADIGPQGQVPLRSDGIIYHKGNWW